MTAGTAAAIARERVFPGKRIVVLGVLYWWLKINFNVRRRFWHFLVDTHVCVWLRCIHQRNSYHVQGSMNPFSMNRMRTYTIRYACMQKYDWYGLKKLIGRFWSLKIKWRHYFHTIWTCKFMHKIIKMGLCIKRTKFWLYFHSSYRTLCACIR